METCIVWKNILPASSALKDGSTMVVSNTGIYLKVHTALQHRRPTKGVPIHNSSTTHPKFFINMYFSYERFSVQYKLEKIYEE
jgi:hypothetical protein